MSLNVAKFVDKIHEISKESETNTTIFFLDDVLEIEVGEYDDCNIKHQISYFQIDRVYLPGDLAESIMKNLTSKLKEAL